MVLKFTQKVGSPVNIGNDLLYEGDIYVITEILSRETYPGGSVLYTVRVVPWE